MTQKEFEERIGREVSTEEYAYADSLYMNCDMDKDKFCNEYKQVKHSVLVHELVDTIGALKRRYERTSAREKEKHMENERLRAIMIGVADRIYKIDFQQVELTTMRVLLMLADELIMDECLRVYYKCRNGVKLNEQDLQALEYNLGIGELAAEDASTIDRMAIG